MSRKEYRTKKEKEARRCLQNGKFGDAVDKFNEAGRELHHSGKSEEAIELLEEGSKIAAEHKKLLERSLCERTLSEIHAELGNKEECLQHITLFRKLAEQCNSHSQVQLSYHVEAWCLQQLFVNGEVGPCDLDDAIKKTTKSRELVSKNKKLFKPEDTGGAANLRMGQLFTLEAQLQILLGNNEKATKLLDKADKIFKSSDKSARFEMLRTKCSIAPVARRIEIAEYMDDEAPEDKKAQTLCELSHQCILANKLKRGFENLMKACILHEKLFAPSEYQDAIKRLGIIYRLVKYSDKLKNPNRPEKPSLCELHEAIGDLYDKYFQTLLEKEKKEYQQFIRDNILKNYEKMLEHKRNDDDVLRANLAMALVCGDLDEYPRSLELFKKRLDLLKKTGASEEKILDTRISIFNCMCKLNKPDLDLEIQFDELEKKVAHFNNTKRELFEVWANYWMDKNDDDKEKKWRAAAESLPDELVKNKDDETDFLFFRLKDKDILDKCKEENELLKLECLSEHQLNKRNDKGETILHQAAQKSNNKAVEILCKKGCDVNARDNGGWTPLSEAVTHEQLENARVLIRYGADVNARSEQSLVTDEESQESSKEANPSKVTPLMDACTNGFIDIAQLLIGYKARVDLQDSAGWTAYNHLKRYIDQNGGDEKMMKFLEDLKDLTSKQAPLNESPAKNKKLKPTEDISDDDSPPDIDNILGVAASRKRKNYSNNFDNFGNSSKRAQRSGENIRFTPPPAPLSTHIGRKRSAQSPMPTYCHPKSFGRQNSSSSLNSIPRNSISPRRSFSPTTTVRSAPSVYGRDDDIQVIGGNIRPHASVIPKVPSPAVVQKLNPSPRLQINQHISEIVVKCCFQLPAGSNEIRPVKLSMNRSTSIAEVKSAVLSSNAPISQFKIKSVWNNEDKDKCGIDELSLLQVADKPNQREIALVFELSAPPAHEIYQEISKQPIAEVTDRLKLFSAEKQLDLSMLFLNSFEMLEVTKTLNKCKRPQNSRLNLSFCELSTEDESNLQLLIDECASLNISNAFSKSGYCNIFEKSKERLEKLELVCAEFREESQIIKLLKNCPNLKTLIMPGIRMSSGGMAYTDSLLPSALIALPNMVYLDLSFNSWISEQNWVELLKGLVKLEELIVNETKNEARFESDWLPNLRSFCARGSDLHWDSIFEMFSVSEKISRIDVRFSTVDSSLPMELKKGNHKINEILY